MANMFLCVRCGYFEGQHDRDLVNRPITAEFAWLEEVQSGCTLCILDCMETALPADYLAKLNEDHLMWADQKYGPTGYQSSDPEKEDQISREVESMDHNDSHSFAFVLGGPVISLD